MKQVDQKKIEKILKQNKNKVSISLGACTHCGLCAESCFLYRLHNHDPQYMPSHKLKHSIGRLYRTRGQVGVDGLNQIQEVVWDKCVLCTRCYCPIGIDIPNLIALARSILRSQGFYKQYDTQ